MSSKSFQAIKKKPCSLPLTFTYSRPCLMITLSSSGSISFSDFRVWDWSWEWVIQFPW
jgi:hypothetical protein